MARTKRHPAWTWKISEFEGDANKWWCEWNERRHQMPVERLVQVMNRKGRADGIGRNAPKWYRRELVQQFRAKQNQALRAAIAQSKDMDALIIEPRQRRNANWMYF